MDDNWNGRHALYDVEGRLLVFYKELLRKPPGQVAAPFLSGTRADYDPAAKNILYVGKATSATWCQDAGFAPENATADQLRNATAAWLAEKKNRSAFWQFGDLLNAQACECNGGQYERWKLTHIAWSNLAKVASKKRNGVPEPQLFAVQADLCRKLLRKEIEVYRPSLVVFATGDYQYGFVNSFFDGPLLDSSDKNEVKIGDDHFIHWKADAPRPAVLWCRHPQGMQPAMREACLVKARELLQGT